MSSGTTSDSERRRQGGGRLRPEDVVLAGRGAGSPESRLAGELGPLGRYWWLIVLGALVGGLLGLVARSGDAGRYEASATVYVGQPVNRNGTVLEAITTHAATAIEIATSDEAVTEAAEVADVEPAELRDGLAVTAVRSPLASKLTSPPAVLEIHVVHEDRAATERAVESLSRHVIAETSEFPRATARAIAQEIEGLEGQARTLRSAIRDAARTGADAVRVATLESALGRLENDLRVARSEQALLNELEPRVVNEPRATRMATTERTSSLLIAAFLGAVAGGALALLLARRARPVG